MEEGAADDAVVGRDVEHVLVDFVRLVVLMLVCLQEHAAHAPVSAATASRKHTDTHLEGARVERGRCLV